MRIEVSLTAGEKITIVHPMHQMATHCNDVEFWRIEFEFEEGLVPNEFYPRLTLHKLEIVIEGFGVFLTRFTRSLNWIFVGDVAYLHEFWTTPEVSTELKVY